MAAKLGIVGLSRAIAMDLQRFNVRSNCIAPFAWSRMVSSIPTETEADKVLVAKLKQMIPEKVAPMVIFLESDACPSRKSYPRVAMMQSGQDWCGDDGSRSLDGSS